MADRSWEQQNWTEAEHLGAAEGEPPRRDQERVRQVIHLLQGEPLAHIPDCQRESDRCQSEDGERGPLEDRERL